MAGYLFNFVLPLELREKLTEYAKAHDLSVAQIIRAALREFLGKVEVAK